jgi:hypothetical protein
MKNIIAFLLVFLFVVSCTPPPKSNPTSSPTVLPILTTPPIPFPELNLESILVQNGDLPAGYSTGQITEVRNDRYKWITNKGVYNISQQIVTNIDDSSKVTVFVYDDIEQVNIAYSQQANSFGENTKISIVGEFTDIGEKATYILIDVVEYGDELDVAEIVFTRCNALVLIRFGYTHELEYLENYANRLDKRLSKLVCM